MSEITIIGTSHIAKESIRKVRKTIKEKKPDVVAVELDTKRYYALTHAPQPQRFSFYNISRVGLKGYLFAVIGSWVSKKLGRMVGVEPGDEMKEAISTAKKEGIKIALIDQDIEVTLARFSRYLTWKERWRIAADVFRGIFFGKREMQRYGISDIDLSKVPPDVLIEKMMGMLEERYPSIYRVLVHERNVYMAARLSGLAAQGMDVVAVVGAGHVKGIRELISMPSYSYSFDYSGQEEQTVGIDGFSTV